MPGEPSDSGSLAGAVALLAGGAPISPSATLPDEASTVSPTPEPSDLAGQARDAIKEAINDGKLSQVEGDLALLFLDGKMRPDPALQDAWRSIVGTAASFLGISAQVLQTDLSSGQSLAQIAQAQRRSLAGLQDTIYSQCKATLDRAVADGAMTTSAENDLLALVQAHLVAAVGSHI